MRKHCDCGEWWGVIKVAVVVVVVVVVMVVGE